MKKNQEIESFEKTVDRFVKQAVYATSPQAESPFFPTHIHIEPTNICNLRCVHCHHHMNDDGRDSYVRKQGLMSMELYRSILNEIGPLGCSVTLDVQGEPLLHPELEEMVRLAKDFGLYTSIITNATRLTPELSERLLDLGLDRVVFSFDAVDKAIYESIRVRSAFEPTLAAILQFLAFNERKGHPTHVCMSMVHQERNNSHVEDYKTYFSKLPVDKVFVNPMLNLCGSAGTCGEINVGEIAPQSRKDWPICRIPWEDLTVNWDGLVTACPVDVNVVSPIGDANTESLQNIWNAKAMQTFRKAHLTKNYSEIEKNGPLCGSCNCLFDPEYDMTQFADYASKAIVRQALHYAHHLTAPNDSGIDGDGNKKDDQQRLTFLNAELERLHSLQGNSAKRPQK